MKTTSIFIISLLCFAETTLAQSVTFRPGALELPNVTALPSCTASTKGRLVFNTTNNKMYYCNGTSWVNTEVTGPQSEPAFSAYNTPAQPGDVNYNPIDDGGSVVIFKAENYDVGNNFNTASAMANINTFVVPANGTYHFDASVSMSLESKMIQNSDKVMIQLRVTSGANTSIAAQEVYAPIANANFSVQISRDLKLATGDKVRLYVEDNIYGTIYYQLTKCFFAGHLATPY